MDRDECIQDDCELFEECWDDKLPNKDIVDEVFEDG